MKKVVVINENDLLGVGYGGQHMGQVIQFKDFQTTKTCGDILSGMSKDIEKSFPYAAGYIADQEPEGIIHPGCLVSVDQEEDGRFFVTVHFRSKKECDRFKFMHSGLFKGLA